MWNVEATLNFQLKRSEKQRGAGLWMNEEKNLTGTSICSQSKIKEFASIIIFIEFPRTPGLFK